MNTTDACQLINTFYSAFQAGDAKGMIACYHDDVRFEDPAFGPLKGKEVGAMWQMLLERGKGNIAISFSNVAFDGQEGSAHWEAKYPFSKTNRQVHNKIDATFRFKDGKIIEHIDVFDLWKWSAMALGLSGRLMGWSSFMKSKIRQQSQSLLKKYMAQHK